MKSFQGFFLLAAATVVLLCAFASASASSQQASRDQMMAAQQQQKQQASGDVLKSAGGHVSKRDYHYDNSWWAIGLVLVPLLLLLCFPLFSTPYYGGHHGGHHGGHGGGHGGWGWGRSAKDMEAIQERVLKSVEPSG